MLFPEQNLLFIHIPKNAGTALENTLNTKYYTITSSLYKWLDESIKNPDITELITPTWKNYIHLYNVVFKDIVDVYHSTLQTYDSVEQKNIIFTVVRHPQKRVESLFKFTGAYKYMSFDEFIFLFIKTDIMPPLTSTQKSFVCRPNGRLDKRVHILRHENLDADWKQFCDKHHLEIGPLTKENVSPAKVEIRWTDELRHIVYKRYKPDFKTFSYELY